MQSFLTYISNVVLTSRLRASFQPRLFFVKILCIMLTRCSIEESIPGFVIICLWFMTYLRYFFKKLLWNVSPWTILNLNCANLLALCILFKRSCSSDIIQLHDHIHSMAISFKISYYLSQMWAQWCDVAFPYSAYIV